MHDLLLTASHVIAIDPVAIPGVTDAINKFIGWLLYAVAVLSLLGLLIICFVGFESYKHNQAEQFMEKAKSWVLAAIIGAYAPQIVGIFFTGFQLSAVATPIPGTEGPVRDIIGNVVWILGMAAFVALLFIAARGFIAFRDNSVGEFVGKFFWWIIASLGVAFATQIAGAFFPAALDLG